MPFRKNVASQLITVFAYDISANTAKTGDAANITAYISKNGAAAAQTNDVNPTELSALNMPGCYQFTMTQAESNCNNLVLLATSTTANVQFDIIEIFPDVENVATIAAGVIDKAAFNSDIKTGDYLNAQVKGQDNIDFGALQKASINAEADTALSDINLDHLMKVAVTNADVIDNTMIAKMISKAATADYDTFNNTTDSLEALADKTGGLTAQETRDALKLAPSAGDPAEGSIDKHLDDIVTQTNKLNFNMDNDVKSTLDGEEVTVATNNDKTGYECTIAGTKTTLDDLNDLDKQMVRDAMKLAPTEPTDLGSIDGKIDDIKAVVDLAATDLHLGEVEDTVEALNNISVEDVKAQADAALSDINLNHLMKDAAVVGDVTNESVIARMTSKATTPAFSSFNNTTDALEALADKTGGLTAQETRDAMKLDASAGAPASGSVDKALDDIQAQTDKLTFNGSYVEADVKEVDDVAVTLETAFDLNDNATNKDIIAEALKTQDVSATPAVTGSVYDDINDNIDAVDSSVAALNDISTSDVKAQADAALSDINLDHLMKAAAVAGDVTDESIIARMTSKSATPSFASFNNTTDALEALADKTGGLTSQETRDAMKLAPSIGAPAAGSIDQHLDDVITDIGALNDISAEDVKAQADLALTDINLDHLMKAAAAEEDVANSSVIARLASKAATPDFGTFNNTTDSLEAIADAETSGLTAQQVRDALKLAPSAGDPAAGSVDKLLTDLQTAVGSLNDISAEDVVTAIWAKVVDGSVTFETLQKINLAFAHGNVEIEDDVFTFYEEDGTTPIITMDVSASGRTVT